MKMSKEEQDQFNSAMDSIAEYQRELLEHNNKILSENNIPVADLVDLLDGSECTGKLSVIKKPTGTNNNKETGCFSMVFCDQYSVGNSGDSFAGFLYGRFSEDKWLKIPYEC